MSRIATTGHSKLRAGTAAGTGNRIHRAGPGLCASGTGKDGMFGAAYSRPFSAFLKCGLEVACSCADKNRYCQHRNLAPYQKFQGNNRDYSPSCVDLFW